MRPYTGLPNCIEIVPPAAEYSDVLSIFKVAATAAQYYVRFRAGWYRCLEKANVCQQTKFLRDNSIDGWDITTSVLEQEAQLSRRDRDRVMLRVIEYFAKSLKVIEGHSNWDAWEWRN